MSSLVIAEISKNSFNPSLRNVVTAAAKFGDVDVLVVGSDVETAAEEIAKISTVAKVIKCESAKYENIIAEDIAEATLSIAKNYSHILTASNTFGKNFLPRVAAKLDVAQVTDVIEVIDQNTFKRPIYAGNAIATIEVSDEIKVMTVRTTSFDAAGEGGKAAIESIEFDKNFANTKYISSNESSSDGPDLSTANVVISGGRGIGSKENFSIIESLAAKIDDCAIGASRAAVDSGFISNDYQVGQTGKIVAPELYIAVGLSGAVQHLAGMSESKIIVAINTDENAPIFDVADYGLVADLFEAVPELEKLLS